MAVDCLLYNGDHDGSLMHSFLDRVICGLFHRSWHDSSVVQDAMLKRGKRTAPSKASETSDSEKAIELYTRYVDQGGEIGPEGVERLCADLGLDPADRKVLILAWKMNAQRMGYFSAAEFERGLRALRAFTLDKIKKALVLQEEDVAGTSSSYQFTDFYEFAFKYCLTEPRQRIIEVETAVQMFSICMEGRPHSEQLGQYLAQQKDYKTINYDQWQSFGRFSIEVKLDCSDFDDEQAWPLILDQYVDWRKQGNPK